MNDELVTVKMDRPLGSAHPDYPAMIYPINYGYVEGIMAGDGEEQDAYVLGVDVPIDEFTGKKIAIVHRNDDVEEKWVVAPENVLYTKQQIEEMVYFQEQYYDSYVEMIEDEIWDAYDENEHKLDFQVPRSMAKSLPEGVFHIVVSVYTMTRDGKVLLTQRSKNKTYPLKWEVTGGSILAGEKPKQGAARELEEETGIKVHPEDLILLYHYIDYEKHSIYYSYLTVLDHIGHISLQYGETMDYQVISYSEFKKLVESDRYVPSERFRFNKHIEQIENIVFGKIKAIS